MLEAQHGTEGRSRTTRSARIILSAILAAGLVVTGCGDDKGKPKVPPPGQDAS